VLQNFNLTIPINTCTAIVGASGSGKSTIASLLVGLYAPGTSKWDPPSLTIGGRDIRTLDVRALRSLVAIVPQTPVLFPTSIAQNISYGLARVSPLNSLSNIRAAASAAGIHDFISTLPQTYFTPVGDGGMGLSGGEAQRIVIARALVRQPRVLILDEATSSLDSESAKVVKQTIKKLVEQRTGLTVIIITHAREMMQVAGNVVVMEKGTVVEEGPFERLLEKNGELRRMLSMGEGFDLE
jgi:ATP-binding cassette, subfamily B (MDR/TAP), member 1